MAFQLRRSGGLLLRGAALSRRGSCGGKHPETRLRVLLDMDGVIADFEGGFLKKYRQRYPNDPYISLEERRGFWVSTQYGELREDLCVSVYFLLQALNTRFIMLCELAVLSVFQWEVSSRVPVLTSLSDRAITFNRKKNPKGSQTSRLDRKYIGSLLDH